MTFVAWDSEELGMGMRFTECTYCVIIEISVKEGFFIKSKVFIFSLEPLLSESLQRTMIFLAYNYQLFITLVGRSRGCWTRLRSVPITSTS